MAWEKVDDIAIINEDTDYIEIHYTGKAYFCSACGNNTILETYDYCSECGAKVEWRIEE